MPKANDRCGYEQLDSSLTDEAGGSEERCRRHSRPEKPRTLESMISEPKGRASQEHGDGCWLEQAPRVRAGMYRQMIQKGRNLRSGRWEACCGGLCDVLQSSARVTAGGLLEGH